jgi:hypothetical protein
MFHVKRPRTTSMTRAQEGLPANRVSRETMSWISAATYLGSLSRNAALG